MIEISNVSKVFNNRSVINNLTALIRPQAFTAITGESGRGKTTLLNLIGLLEKPTKGSIVIEGIVNPKDREIMMFQRHKFGYLFQNYALVENETVLNNLAIALKYRGKVNKQDEVERALQFVNLKGFEHKKIYELSGGEQQRIALARVIVKGCKYIFADEPTGNLDLKNRNIVFEILKELNREGTTVVHATHDAELVGKSDELINLDKT